MKSHILPAEVIGHDIQDIWLVRRQGGVREKTGEAGAQYEEDLFHRESGA
jgi:hypothetical protein